RGSCAETALVTSAQAAKRIALGPRILMIQPRRRPAVLGRKNTPQAAQLHYQRMAVERRMLFAAIKKLNRASPARQAVRGMRTIRKSVPTVNREMNRPRPRGRYPRR